MEKLRYSITTQGSIPHIYRTLWALNIHFLSISSHFFFVIMLWSIFMHHDTWSSSWEMLSLWVPLHGISIVQCHTKLQHYHSTPPQRYQTNLFPLLARRTKSWSVSGTTFWMNTCSSSCSPYGPNGRKGIVNNTIHDTVSVYTYRPTVYSFMPWWRCS